MSSQSVRNCKYWQTPVDFTKKCINIFYSKTNLTNKSWYCERRKKNCKAIQSIAYSCLDSQIVKIRYRPTFLWCSRPSLLHFFPLTYGMWDPFEKNKNRLQGAEFSVSGCFSTKVNIARELLIIEQGQYWP